MPTFNKVDMMDCANGSHNYEHGGEHGDPCTVCGHVETESQVETESHGVAVWLCATIYVDAESEEQAEKLVVERYAETRDAPNDFTIASDDIRIWHDFKADYLSGMTTAYGLAKDSKLVPEVDPVRDAAPDMLAILEELAFNRGEEYIHEDDRVMLVAAINKAKGGAA